MGPGVDCISCCLFAAVCVTWWWLLPWAGSTFSCPLTWGTAVRLALAKRMSRSDGVLVLIAGLQRHYMFLLVLWHFCHEETVSLGTKHGRM